MKFLFLKKISELNIEPILYLDDFIVYQALSISLLKEISKNCIHRYKPASNFSCCTLLFPTNCTGVTVETFENQQKSRCFLYHNILKIFLYVFICEKNKPLSSVAPLYPGDHDLPFILTNVK